MGDSALIEVVYRNGIYVPEADLWLDPHFGVPRAFVSHAHSDHVARHKETFCSEVTALLMRERYGWPSERTLHELPVRTAAVDDGWEMKLLPAGHIIGSAMLHLTRRRDGATLLYTGDYKLRQGMSSERCELLPAETLIMECTFGLPQFRFPPTSETVAAVLKFVRETLDDGGIPVLLGYSLGKAQEVLCALADVGVPVMLHPSVMEMTKAVQHLLGKLPEIKLFDGANVRGHVLVFPPGNAKSQALKKLKVCRMAMLSGWALQPGAKYRYQVDEVFPLSDHADHPELLETVEIVKPKRVYLVHGSTREFAAELRAKGYDAWSLELADQLELRMDGLRDEKRNAQEATAPAMGVGSFADWAATCAATAEESSRLKKVSRLAGMLEKLCDGEVKLAARFAAGSTGRKPLNTGWMIIKRALMELSNLNEVEYRSISRSQADAGRTANLLLQRATLEPSECSLRDVEAFFDSLREAGGQMERVRLLKERLRTLDAVTGSWLVRLITGDLRMGSKEGLIEEGIAHAFGESADEVREAAMLLGDIGEAASLARQHRLAEACPVLFVPVRVMLASPEESAAAIWERLAGEGDTSLWLEDKYDGIRAQLHRGSKSAEIYSRDLKPIGAQFPELLRTVESMTDEVILDGEIIAFAEDRKLSFFDLQKRLGRRDQADLFLPSDISVRYVVFDVLWRNGESLMNMALADRRKVLESLSLPEGIVRIDVETAVDAGGIEVAFQAARRRGNEGLIVKDTDSSYTPGRRGKSWLKLKKAMATLDVVVVKAEQGHGKRSHVLSDYTFAVRDDKGALRVIGKAYSGLTDAEIESLTEHFTVQTLEQKGRVRTVVPDTVLEIAFDSIQASNRHDSGLAMRFPRIKAIRQDKTPAEIDTLEYARRLAGLA